VAPGFRPVQNALCSPQLLVEDEHEIEEREGVMGLDHDAAPVTSRTGRKPGATTPVQNALCSLMRPVKGKHEIDAAEGVDHDPRPVTSRTGRKPGAT
jgi:hypothetical protein